ncbi:MAG: HEAT repeat domain-containing protein [Solirubrobacteraceae bacterium]|nr:HEAT repeat domain-containing protein [Solirubrobacteraceae bacterium]
MTEFGALTVEELFAYALREGFDEIGDDEWAPGVSAIVELQHRGDRAALERSIELLSSVHPIERRLGVQVLAEIREHPRAIEPGWMSESVESLLQLADREEDVAVLAEVARAFGYRGDHRAIPVLLRWVGHPAQPVRFGVASSLASLGNASSAEAADVERVLLCLAEDESGAVRDYALWSLNERGHMSEAVLAAMDAHDDDPDKSPAREARRGLRRLGEDLDWDDD